MNEKCPHCLKDPITMTVSLLKNGKLVREGKVCTPCAHAFMYEVDLLFEKYSKKVGDE